MKAMSSVAVIGALVLNAGCGTVTTSDFPNRLLGAQGQRIVVEDIEMIVRDPTLNDDQKRAGLRDLGIEDEKLITALLAL